MVMPDLEEWVTLFDHADVGDENGDGDYTYPLAGDFALQVQVCLILRI